MDQNIYHNKIKLCLVGTGEWGSRVANVAEMLSRFEIVGTINSKTPDEEKQGLLKSADMVYIAIPQESQAEYINFCIDNNKFTVCEAPFLSSLEQRKEMFEKIKQTEMTSPLIVNSGYYMDIDFARIISESMISKADFISIDCQGPKHIDSPEKAKKFYINQSIFLNLQITAAKQIDRIDKFIVNDNYSGSFNIGNKTLEFKWSHSDTPQNIIRYGKKNSNELKEKKLIYDEYDQIFPILKNISDQYYKIINPAMFVGGKTEKEVLEMFNQINLRAFIISSSAEYFSDMFCSSPSAVINDPTKLFINGGF